MKRFYSYFILSLIFLSLFSINSTQVYTNSNGAPEGYSGSVGNELNTCISCHNINPMGNSPSQNLTINSTIEEYYIPGQTYYFTISVTGTGVNEFGFQACIENSMGDKMGTLTLVDPSQTQLISSGDYITHTASGTTGLGAKTWGFYWQAPTSMQDEVIVYVSALLSNNNGQTTGDKVLSTSQSYFQATMGCTDSLALNYNAFATTNDASCFYNLSTTSSLSISYDSLTIIGNTFDDELICNLNVHNNSDTNQIVYVSRNILSDNVPLNWFCWDACFLPTTDVSPIAIDIAPNSYTSEFSAHLAPGLYGGDYLIEYCFYTESNLEDSLCTTVNYIVEGDIPGCMDINALNYNELSNLDDGSCILYPQPNWEFSDTLDFTHDVLLTLETDIQINNSPIAEGDWIGVFYESSDGLICAGYTEWTAQNINISVDGSEEGLAFIWQIWDASEGVSWPMEVTYSENFEDSGFFVAEGQSAIASMYNVNPITEQNLLFPSGWSLFSTYMITEDMNIMTVLEPIVDDLIIVKDNEGNAYLVEYQFNALGNLQAGQGYLLKTTQASSLTLQGAYAKPDLHPIQLQEGWNMIGYLYEEPLLAEDVFEELVDLEVIQIVKDYMGNAYIPEWYFNGIGEMMPGNGYQVKTFEAAVLQY